MDFAEEGDQVLQAAAEPINRPGHDHVELPTAGIAAHRIKGRPLVPALAAAYAVVLIDLGYFATHPLGDLPELALLVGCLLVDGRYPQVENCTPHLGLPLENIGRGIAAVVLNINCYSVHNFRS